MTFAGFSAGRIVTADDLTQIGYHGLGVLRLERETTQSVSNATDTPISFDRQVLDLFGGHSTSVNADRYTVTVPGYYTFMGGVSFTTVSGTTQIQAFLRKNGTDNVAGSHATDTADTGTAPMSVACKSALLPMEIGDYVELMGRHTSGAAINTATTLARRPYLIAMYSGEL